MNYQTLKKTITFNTTQSLWERIGLALRLVIFDEITFDQKPLRKLITAVVRKMKDEKLQY